MGSVIEFSLDGGQTWHHGLTLEAWAAADAAVVRRQRGVVRAYVRREAGNVESIATRVLAEDDPRAAVNRVTV